MEKDQLISLHANFEGITQTEESGCEFWYARDLQDLLGYSQWRNFEPVIEKAIISSENAKIDPLDHFARVRKMVDIGSGAKREIEDIVLSRYACYLIAQNGDPAKEAIAFAQTYFAVQTRKMEIIEQRLEELERLSARQKLSESERLLSGIIFERLGENQSFARIRSKGDSALFGGLSTQEMKDRLGMSKGRPLADFLPAITIKAKDFANEITNFNIKKEDLTSEPTISREHVKNNREVRKLLVNQGIVPESLPPAEDIKKIQRRVASEHKKIAKNPDKLERKAEDDAGESI